KIWEYENQDDSLSDTQFAEALEMKMELSMLNKLIQMKRVDCDRVPLSIAIDTFCNKLRCNLAQMGVKCWQNNMRMRILLWITKEESL
ncbi:MAG: hypothetical protein IIX99_01095, partial [Oscillospiraceae bacterium]|nr:hypothetical protein [Oscillospiraceae bacterium]